jgi:hypothetical protein
VLAALSAEGAESEEYSTAAELRRGSGAVRRTARMWRWGWGFKPRGTGGGGVGGGLVVVGVVVAFWENRTGGGGVCF